MRKKRYLFLAAGAAGIPLLLLLFFNASNSVSEPARAVIAAMAAATNEELFASTAWPLGGSALTEQEKEAIRAQSKEVFSHWETMVGGYFCDGGLADFLLAGPGQRFHSLAKDSGVESAVSRIDLLEKSDRYETVLATVLTGGAPHDIHVTFRYNPDGKIYDVSVDEINELNTLFQ